MLNLTKRVDYGLIALTHLAVIGSRHKNDAAPARLSVRGAADSYGMSQPLLANVMKDLVRHGFVRSARGTKGGYELSVPPEALSVGRIVEALEGPLRLTECMNESGGTDHDSPCTLFDNCLIKRSMFIIHVKIRDALYGITIADLASTAAKNAGNVHAVSDRLPMVQDDGFASGEHGVDGVVNDNLPAGTGGETGKN
jgi:Rrf2 family protein